MTKRETIAIMAMLSAFYGQGKSDAEAMANAWYVVLEPYNFAEAQAAVVAFARNDIRDYATFPPPGKIVQAIEEIRTQRNRAINEVYMAIVLNNREYDELSNTARAICPPSLYEEWKRYTVRHADEFCQNETKYKAILRGNLDNLITGGTA